MTAVDADFDVLAEAHRPSVAAAGEKITGIDEKGHAVPHTSSEDSFDVGAVGNEPTMEEMKTLRRISGPINWQAMTITFVEFCERFSYYGTTAVFVNFIQQPRPYGSRTGNIQLNQACYDAMGSMSACAQPGGLGQDQKAATGLTVCALRLQLTRHNWDTMC